MNNEKAKEAVRTDAKDYGSTKEPIQFSQPPSMPHGPPPAYGFGDPSFAPVRTAPRDYLALSIFSILCCFMPLGIVALIRSTEVRSHLAGHRYSEAQTASRSARRFNLLSIIIGSIIAIVVATVAAVAFINVVFRALFSPIDFVIAPIWNVTTDAY